MANTIRRGVKSEVTCPLCQDIFTDPKRLPCDHVYCKECLRGLALQTVTGSISCPDRECRRDIPIPNNDVANFPTPQQVIRLIEMHMKSAKTATSQQAAATCGVHNSQALDLYCETCKSLVCRDCVIKTCTKKNHEYGFNSEVVEKYQTALRVELEPVRKLRLQTSSILDTMTAAEEELQGKKKEQLQQIESTFDALAKILEDERRHFKESIEKSFEDRDRFNSAKRNQVSKMLEEMQSLIHYTDVTSIQESGQEFLSGISRTRQRIEDVDASSKSLQLEPTPSPEMEVELLNPAELEDLCKTRNFTYQKGDVLKGHVERTPDLDLTKVSVDETVEVSLNLQAQNLTSKKAKISMTADLHCCHDNSTQKVSIKKISADKYTLSLTPKQRGRHELHIKCNDRHICGSPLPVYAAIEPHLLATISTPQVTNEAGVIGFKCHRGKLFASIFKKRIHVLESLTNHTDGGFNVIEMAGINKFVTDGVHIYATDIARDQIVKMTLNGTVTKSAGSKGDGPGEFSFPNGIRFGKDDKLYVCDSGNDRVQVFDGDLNFERVIGSKGEGNGCFIYPTDLDFDDAGNIYVVDQGNNRIQVLTRQDQHTRNIGETGSGLGELEKPVSAAIHRNMIYVTDTRNKRISVFKLTGEPVAKFGEDILADPECIAIDDNGYIHVTDSRSKIVVF